MSKKVKIQTSAIVTADNKPLSKIDNVVSDSGLKITAGTKNVTVDSGTISVKDDSAISLTSGTNPTLALKNDTLTAGSIQFVGGDNVTITGNGSQVSISAAAGSSSSSTTPSTPTSTTYSAGTGIKIDNNIISLQPTLTSGQYGPTGDVTVTTNASQQTIKIPQLTVDNTGRVTSVTERSLKLQDTNTDTNTDTHYTANLSAVGVTGGAAVSLTENNTTRNTISIVGGGNTTVSYSSNKLTISSTGGDSGGENNVATPLKVSLGGGSDSVPVGATTTTQTVKAIGTLPVSQGGTGQTSLSNVTVGKASQLETARSLKVSLSSSAAGSFNGAADLTNIGVAGTLPVANGGTGKTSLDQVTVGGAANAASVSGHTVAIDIPSTAKLTDTWLQTASSISDTVNLNDLAPGHYYIPTLAEDSLQSDLNYPSVSGGQPPAANDRILTIGDGAIKLQIWYSKLRSNHRRSNVFFRNYSSSGWTDWYPLMTASQDLMKVTRYNSGTVNLKECTTQGSYWINNSCSVTEAPSNYSGSYDSILVVFGNTNNVTGEYAQGIAQLLLSPSNSSHPAWVRYKYGTTWGAWSEIGGAVDLAMSVSTLSGGAQIALTQNSSNVSSPVTLVGGTNITVSGSGNKLTITGPTVPAATAAASLTAGSGGGGATLKANAGAIVSIVGGGGVSVSGTTNKVSISAAAATPAASITAGSGGGGATIKANEGATVSIVGGNNVTVSGASNKVSISAAALNFNTGTSAPSNPQEGMLWLNQDQGKLQIFHGSSWVNVSNP